MIKKNKKIETCKGRYFNKIFISFLLFVLITETVLIIPSTSKAIQKIPTMYSSLFYFVVFLFPIFILLSYYFRLVLDKNKNKCDVKVLFSSVLKGAGYFILFLVLLAFAVLDGKQLASLFLSQPIFQAVALVGLSVLIFYFLMRIYHSGLKNSKTEKRKK